MRKNYPNNIVKNPLNLLRIKKKQIIARQKTRFWHFASLILYVWHLTTINQKNLDFENIITNQQPKKYIEFYCWDIELNFKEFLKPIKKNQIKKSIDSIVRSKSNTS